MIRIEAHWWHFLNQQDIPWTLLQDDYNLAGRHQRCIYFHHRFLAKVEWRRIYQTWFWSLGWWGEIFSLWCLPLHSLLWAETSHDRIIISDPSLIRWFMYGVALASPRQFHTASVILPDMELGSWTTKFDGRGSGTDSRGSGLWCPEREPKFSRMVATSLRSVISSRPISRW